MDEGSTIEYYNKNAREFYAGTLFANVQAIQETFLEKLPMDGLILDFGCGSGRDTKYFMEKGFQVEAMDGSSKLCKMAGEYTGIQVKQALFQDLDEVDKYDGIWACSSILHVPMAAQSLIFRKMARALKANGVIYVSYKYGVFEGKRNGRYFTDMTERTFWNLVKDMPELEQEKQWVTSDVRPGREDEQWLNIILRKKWISQAAILERKN